MASITGQEIREELVKYGLIRRLGQATATAGGTNRLRDATRLDNAGLASTAYDGCYVRATGGNVDGEQVMVDYLDQDAGDLYVDPAWSVAPNNSTTYEIWRAGIDPDIVDRLRDEALTSYCSQWQPVPLSIVTNAGYHDGVTNWTAGNSATRAQQTSTFPTEIWPFTMLVTNNGATANGRIASASIYALRAETHFYLYVPVSVRSGTAQVIVRDVTNSVNISLNQTDTETRRGWSGIEVTGQVPATCDEIQVWLVGQEATAIVEWGPVFMHPQEARRMQIDPRVDTNDKVGPVHTLSWFPTSSGRSEAWNEELPDEVSGTRPLRVNDAVFIQFRERPMLDIPYYYEERMFYTALQTAYFTTANRTTGDAATTLCSLDYAAAATARAIALEMIAYHPHEKEFYAGVLAIAEQRLGVMEKRYGPAPKPSLERARTLSIPYFEI